MIDPTEGIRREMVAEINTSPPEREALESEYGQVWNTEELSRDFEVLSFLAPFISVTRKADGARGAMMFQDRPRYYFNFTTTRR